MSLRLTPLAATAILLAIAGCVPAPAEFSQAEAMNVLTSDMSRSSQSLRFVPGSDRLAPGEAERLTQMVAAGRLRPEDRIRVSAPGNAELGLRRSSTLARELTRRGISADIAVAADARRDEARLDIERVAITSPNCPNWSKQPFSDFSNSPSSNFGCATTINLGLMAANPSDLVHGRPLGFTDAGVTGAAIGIYRSGPVELPSPPGQTSGTLLGGMPNGGRGTQGSAAAPAAAAPVAGGK